VKLKIQAKTPSSPDSIRFINRYLGELIDYGGEPCTRAEAILHMQSIGIDQPCIDRWLQGYERAQHLREHRTRIATRLFLDTQTQT
jgi:hypothetical protein